MAAASPQYVYTPPWPSTLYQEFNRLVEYSKDSGLDFNKSILSGEFKPILQLLTKIVFNVSRGGETIMKDDRDLAYSIGKDLLQSNIEIILNERYRFEFQKESNEEGFTEEEMRKYITENPKSDPELLKILKEQLANIKPIELQVIEQLYKFLNDNSCTIRTEYFLFLLIGMQQSISNSVLNSIQEILLQHIEQDYVLNMMNIKPFVDKIIFNIQCNPLSRHLSIRTTLKYHLQIFTRDGEQNILLPFELTDIVFVLDLSDIESEDKPGLTLENTAIHELLKLYSIFYSIFQKVPGVINSQTREINYEVFSNALEKKIKDRIKYVENRGEAVQQRMALKGSMGGKRQKKTRIRHVSKKHFKRSRRQRNQRKSKQNK